jgi:hypothetical protein
MQFRAFEPGIEVKGQTVWAVIDAFDHFKQIPTRILAAEGIGTTGADGLLQVDSNGWYSQEAWLRAFERIATEVGESKLHAIGLRVPLNAQFPPRIETIFDAIGSIDVAYHMHHRKGGRVMYDGATRTMLAGIGHYGFERIGPQEIRSVCDNPYPCSFDRGIITTMARRFERGAVVEHDERAPCRRRGANSCTYRVRF